MKVAWPRPDPEGCRTFHRLYHFLHFSLHRALHQRCREERVVVKVSKTTSNAEGERTGWKNQSASGSLPTFLTLPQALTMQADHADYVTQTFQRNSARLESQPFGPIEIEDCGLVTARREVDPPRAPSSITRLPQPWKRDFEL